MAEGEEREQIQRERSQLLHQWEEWLDAPLQVLGVLWLLLLVVEFTAGLSPWMYRAGLVIWAIFVVEFSVRLALAERRMRYLRNNFLNAVALLLPALRLVRAFRLLQLVRASRGLRLARVLGTLNRGIGVVRSATRRRGLGYVLLLTLTVTLVGAAGIYSFERTPAGHPGLRTYGDALWWTAMLLTTLGSDYWPRTPEGRILCLALAIYGFAVFGYIAGAFASFFVGRDTRHASPSAPQEPRPR